MRTQTASIISSWYFLESDTFTSSPSNICWQTQSVGAGGGSGDWKSKLLWVLSFLAVLSYLYRTHSCVEDSSCCAVSESRFCPDNCWQRGKTLKRLTSKHGRPFNVDFAYGDKMCVLIKQMQVTGKAAWKSPGWDSKCLQRHVLLVLWGIFPRWACLLMQKGHEEGPCGYSNRLHTRSHTHSSVLRRIRW